MICYNNFKITFYASGCFFWYGLTRVVLDKGPLTGLLHFMQLALLYFAPMLNINGQLLNADICDSYSNPSRAATAAIEISTEMNSWFPF